MSHQGKIISVFGSSRPRAEHADYEEARALGRALAERGFVVCTGGYGGVMEGASRGAKEACGRTIGVTSKFFKSRPNSWLDEEHPSGDWQERLFALVNRGHGYVACKGGTGTLVELAVVWEMLNKKVIAGKPCVALGDFWAPILDRVREVEMERGSRWGEGVGRLVHTASQPADAAEFLVGWFANDQQRSSSEG